MWLPVAMHLWIRNVAALRRAVQHRRPSLTTSKRMISITSLPDCAKPLSLALEPWRGSQTTRSNSSKVVCWSITAFASFASRSVGCSSPEWDSCSLTISVDMVTISTVSFWIPLEDMVVDRFQFTTSATLFIPPRLHSAVLGRGDFRTFVKNVAAVHLPPWPDHLELKPLMWKHSMDKPLNARISG